VRRTFMLAALAAALAVPSSVFAAGTDPAAKTDGNARNADATSETGGVTSQARSSVTGCRKVDIAKTVKDIFGFVVYRFHHVKRWCWDFPRITSVTVSTYVSDVDPNMEYDGIVSAAGWYYEWCCRKGKSGHYSFRQGKFKNCILWFPCTRVEYPWVKIWAHADGTYVWARGLT
jgi:hypothetical protein